MFESVVLERFSGAGLVLRLFWVLGLLPYDLRRLGMGMRTMVPNTGCGFRGLVFAVLARGWGCLAGLAALMGGGRRGLGRVSKRLVGVGDGGGCGVISGSSREALTAYFAKVEE